MANRKFFSFPLKHLLSLLLLALTVTCAASARIHDEEETPVPTTGAPVASGSVATPVANAGPAVVATTPAVANAGPAVVATTPAVANVDPHHPLVFFMHDILGGSKPSAVAVTGIVTNSAVNGQVPFAKPNGANLPLNNDVPQNNNNNNIPFLTGLSGNTANVIQNNGNNNNFNGGFTNVPILNEGQASSGSVLQKLMFGTLTVIDDELTEGHELGSGLVGKAQGFYVASSEDGTSQTMAFTAMFVSGGYADSISFFGVHRTAVSESQFAIMGGTGKYLNAKGFATVKTFPANNQHETDGAETLLQFTARSAIGASIRLILNKLVFAKFVRAIQAIYKILETNGRLFLLSVVVVVLAPFRPAMNGRHTTLPDRAVPPRISCMKNDNNGRSAIVALVVMVGPTIGAMLITTGVGRGLDG
ncbi:hypothetical protein QYF36_002067 [Acer negundo]|nr:hypothetical protein QYF36_002067 [Acer negundo]